MFSISHIIATFFGSGCLPYAPGTSGSLAGLAIAFIGYRYQLHALSYLIISGILFVVGWLATERILKDSFYQDRDPSFIVIDEVVGLLITIGLVGLYRPITPTSLILSFFMFRLFDIFKPWPICWLDKTLAQSIKTATLGVMTDDLVAGIMAALATAALLSVYS
jgi:phosphatidylglycerophosphatase A